MALQPPPPEIDDFTPRPQFREFTGQLIVQEVVRTLITLSLATLLGITIVFAFRDVNGPNWANTKELLLILLPVETGLLGSAVGFYFGSQGRR